MEAEPESIHDTLKLLSEGDWRLLRERSNQKRYRRNEVIIEAGEQLANLYVLQRGVVRIQQSRLGIPIVLARMHAGEVIGEMSLLETTVASASVVAEADVEVDVIPFVHLHTLLAQDTGFASRFYHSIAISLSSRLRANSRMLAEFGQNMSEAVRLDRHASTRMGQISEMQIPEALDVEVQAIRAELHEVERELRNRKTDEARAREKVKSACDRIVSALVRYTSSEALLEIGYTDLLAFRDTSQLEVGIGQLIFRETFPLLMSSATIARLYDKPRGFPDDFETMELIHRNEPEGDGWLGAMIDEWFLNRPLMVGRRNIRKRVARLLADVCARTSGPTRLLDLASGSARELLDLFAGGVGAEVEATCIDLDEQALVFAANAAKGRPWVSQIGFITGNVMRFDDLTDRLALEPQHCIYATALIDYLANPDAVALLDWSFDRLTDGGTLAFSNVLDTNPDARFMEHLMEWTLNHRSRADLESLCAASKFKAKPKIEVEESGTTALVILQKH